MGSKFQIVATWLLFSTEEYQTFNAMHDFLDKEDSWNSRHFFHKPHLGFYAWPVGGKIQVYDRSKSPKLDRDPDSEMSEGERAIHQFFHNEENLDKLIKFLSLEEVKGRDRFNVKRWILFKGLFRNYGPGMLAPFVPHLERLVKSREESLQRCATGAVTNSDMF